MVGGSRPSKSEAVATVEGVAGRSMAVGRAESEVMWSLISSSAEARVEVGA